jgi:hypothetical protein
VQQFPCEAFPGRLRARVSKFEGPAERDNSIAAREIGTLGAEQAKVRSHAGGVVYQDYGLLHGEHQAAVHYRAFQ